MRPSTPRVRPERGIRAPATRILSRLTALGALVVLFFFSGVPAPTEATAVDQNAVVIAVGQPEPEPSDTPALEPAPQADFTGVLVFAGATAAVFVFIGITFYRMVRRNRLD